MIDARVKVDAGALARLEEAAWEGLQRAVVYYHGKVIEALNVPNSGERRKSRTRKTKSGRAASYTVYPSPSRPGEPPRKRTGFLQRNVRYAFDRGSLSARVGIGANARYGLFLELGTNRGLKPRPFLLSTLRRHLGQVAALARARLS